MSKYEQFLLNGEFLPAANALIVPKYESSGEWTGVWAHEYFHFLQLSGTKMGQLLSFMFACIGHFAGAFLRDPPDELKRTTTWRFPLLLWATFEQDKNLAECLRKHFGFTLFQVETLCLYLGELPSLGQQNKWLMPHLWAWGTQPPEDTILPVVFSCDGEEIGLLGTLSIIETAAALQGLRMEDTELVLDSNRIGFGITDRQRQILMNAPLRYHIALRYVEEQTSIPNALAISVTSIAADLALESGFDDLAENRSSTPLAWEDWYPGWRFVRATKAMETMLAEQDVWPETEEELKALYTVVRKRCAWTEPLARFNPALSVSPDKRFASDTARQLLAEEAMALRSERISLWSVGPRENLVQASVEWFRPPVFLEYGQDKIHAPRKDLDEGEVGELWEDAQLQHIAWQLMGHANPRRCEKRIECFYWAKEGSDKGCEQSNGVCRWFPTNPKTPLPDECPMLRIIKRLCGEYWARFVPM